MSTDQTNIISSQITAGVVAVLRHHGLLPDQDSPPGTVRVPMDFTPGVLRGLRRRGFLTSETPDGIIAAVFGMLGAAIEADVRAKPEPAPTPPPAAAPAPAPAAPPLAPAASPPVAKAPPKPKAAKAPPLATDPPPADDVEGFAAEPDAPGPPPAARTNGEEFDPEIEARRRWIERMAKATS
jgi:hypothetical protein